MVRRNKRIKYGGMTHDGRKTAGELQLFPRLFSYMIFFFKFLAVVFQSVEHADDLNGIPLDPKQQEIIVPLQIDPFQIPFPEVFIIRNRQHSGCRFQGFSGISKIYE